MDTKRWKCGDYIENQSTYYIFLNKHDSGRYISLNNSLYDDILIRDGKFKRDVFINHLDLLSILYGEE